MRIISSFRDYYDQHDYAEDDSVYVRETKTIIEQPIHKTRREDIRVNDYIIGFCGEIFPFIKVTVSKNFEIVHTKFCYAKKEFDTKDEEFGFTYGRVFNPLAHFDKDFSRHKKEFLEHKTPIFIKELNDYRDEELMFVVNPVLIDYKFAKIKDAQTANQDIDMFISNVLTTREVMVDIDDKYRLEAHGYNKESFRMPKGRKKPRRRK